MKNSFKSTIILTLMVLVAFLQSCGNKSVTKLNTFNDSINYSWGVFFGQSAEGVVNNNEQMDKNVFYKSLLATINGKNTMSTDTARVIINDYNQKFIAAAQAIQGDSAKLANLKLTPGVDFDPLKMSEATGVNIGYNITSSFEQAPWGFDKKLLCDGLMAYLDGKKLLIEPAAAEQLLNDFSKKLQEEEMKKQNANNVTDELQAGMKFMEEYKTREGVKSTESGLLYTVKKQGNGPKPTAADKVKVHYTGTLINGQKFDSSLDRGEPTVFPLNAVIAGWTEILQLMPVGSTYQVVIPPQLAYGDRNIPGIPPNSTLIFDIELISIEK